MGLEAYAGLILSITSNVCFVSEFSVPFWLSSSDSSVIFSKTLRIAHITRFQVVISVEVELEMTPKCNGQSGRKGIDGKVWEPVLEKVSAHQKICADKKTPLLMNGIYTSTQALRCRCETKKIESQHLWLFGGFRFRPTKKPRGCVYHRCWIHPEFLENEIEIRIQRLKLGVHVNNTG